MNVKIYLFFAVLFYFTHVLTSLAGIFLADILNVGHIIFNLPRDVKKMVICSFLALPIPLVILFFVQSSAVIILYVFSFWFFTKVAYLNHVTVADIGIVVITNLLGMGIFRIIIESKFLLYPYILGLVFLIVFYIYLGIKEKKAKKSQEQFETKRKAEIRKIVQLDPKFQTNCVECQHYCQFDRECSLDRLNQKKEIKLYANDRLNIYCLYWQISGVRSKE